MNDRLPTTWTHGLRSGALPGSLEEIERRFSRHVKTIAVVLFAACGAAGLGYALDNPHAGNAGWMAGICVGMIVVALAFLALPVDRPERALLVGTGYGIWSIVVAAAATLLAWLDSGLLSPFVIFYLVSMVFSGIAAPRRYVIAVGVVSFGGFLLLHEMTGVPWNSASQLTMVLLVVVLVTAAWVAAAQETRARWTEALSIDLASEMERTEWMIEHVPVGLVQTDASGRITAVNPMACTMFGRSAGEVLGLVAHDTFHHSRPDGTPLPVEECHVNLAIAEGRAAHKEGEVYWRADGTSLQIDVNTVPSPDGGAMVMFQDVTERLATQRMKDQFISVVSHELRTPLTSIRGALGLLAGGAVGDLPPDVGKMVGIAATNTDRLSRLINDILDVERLDAGKMVLQTETIDVAQVAADAVDELQMMATDRGVTLRASAPPIHARADRDRVLQVLVNLLGNATKFSPEGGEVVVDASIDDEGMVRIDVIDGGRGIPDAMQERIFDRFEQVDASDSRTKGGVGLGLTISQGIIEAHGGQIWFDSQVGLGTTFSFTLPQAPTPVSAPSGPGHGPRVLVVVSDDEERRSIADVLDRNGYQPSCAATGARGIEMAGEEHPMAILLDADLRDMDAWEVIRTLRNRSDTAALSVVLLGELPSGSAAPLADSVRAFIDRTTLHATLLPTLDRAVGDPDQPPVVLIVEDDPDLAEVLGAGFRDRGLRAANVQSSADAKAWLEHATPTVVLLDLLLPDGCGAEVISELRAGGRLDEVSIAVYTALDVTPDGGRGMGIGAADLFVKSRVSPERVMERVMELIGRAAPVPTGGPS